MNGPPGAVTERAYALDCDAEDPLAIYRSKFVVADEALCYLDGNSLGRLPVATGRRVAEVTATEWGSGLIRSWDHWLDLPGAVGDRVAGLAGAQPGEVIVADSTTVNFYRLASAALDARPGRSLVIAARADFPTNRYVLQGLAMARGLELGMIDADPVEGPTGSDVAAAIGSRSDDVALIALSHVHYRSAAVADMAGITAIAHQAGALALWDLSHAVGAIAVDLDGSGADLAVGCTYKYLNGGPGSPAWLYVRRALQTQLRPPVWGWMGARQVFAMSPQFEAAADITGWLTGTPAVLGLVCADEGVRLVAQAGIGAIRAKSELLTTMVMALVESWLVPRGFATATPPALGRRGSHVAVRHPQASALCRALVEHCGVVVDFRPPDVLRIGLSPLTTSFVEAWDGVARLRQAFDDGLHVVA